MTLHYRYLYRNYLRIAALDMIHNRNVLHTILWDTSQPIATCPPALQKDGTWYTYGLGLTKNVWELFDHDGAIRTAYDYTPYGEATANGASPNPFSGAVRCTTPSWRWCITTIAITTRRTAVD